MEFNNLQEIIVEENDAPYLNQVEKLLNEQGLKRDKDIEYTIAIENGEEIIATGSFGGNVLKCIAVNPEYRGMGILNMVISNLISEEYRRGNTHLFIYTKPSNQKYFKDLGFYKIAEVPGHIVLFENRADGIKKYIDGLKKNNKQGKKIGSVVVNCNPFTLGHKYLIEKASKESDVLHVFVVSEDRSLFPFKTRYALVKEGTKHLNNVTLHESGDYIISNATFPTYFIKDLSEAVKIHTLLDIEIFAKYIAPALGINKRFIGEEPICKITRIYNDTMKEMLPRRGIEVEEIPRLVVDGQVVSASIVRQLIREGNFQELRKLVPETTYNFIISREAEDIIKKSTLYFNIAQN